MDNTNDKMLKIEDTTEEFGISRRTLYRWIDMGLPNYKVGRTVFFLKNEVFDWICTHRREGKKKEGEANEGYNACSRKGNMAEAID